MAVKIIKIGTRDSELALWQAKTVEKLLNNLGYKTDIIAVKSDGDLLLDKPLYELGITGIFTKTLIKSEWDNTVLAKGDLVTEVNKLKNQNGKDIIAYGCGKFVSALIKENLIDELHLFINPSIIGNGMPIFRDVKVRLACSMTGQSDLEPIIIEISAFMVTP